MRRSASFRWAWGAACSCRPRCPSRSRVSEPLQCPRHSVLCQILGETPHVLSTAHVMYNQAGLSPKLLVLCLPRKMLLSAQDMPADRATFPFDVFDVEARADRGQKRSSGQVVLCRVALRCVTTGSCILQNDLSICGSRTVQTHKRWLCATMMCRSG